MEDVDGMLVIVDSVTDLRSEHRGLIAVTGSHGGLYPGAVAHEAGVHAAVFCDAGRGRDDAGIAGLQVLQRAGIPAAAASADSCRIGEGQDVLDSGRISACNSAAANAGVEVGFPVREAVALLASSTRAPAASADDREDARGSDRGDGSHSDAIKETRSLRTSSPFPVWTLDSASLVTGADSGSIVVTGSHGGAPGGHAARALKCIAKLAAFNDAGVGKDQAGLGRLPLLEERGISAVTVSAISARIGDGASTLDDGIISAANAGARRLGAEPGMPLAHLVEALQRSAPLN